MSDQVAGTDVKLGVSARLNLLFITTVMAAITVGIALFASQGFSESRAQLASSHIYVSISSWDLPCLVGIPCCIVVTAILSLRLFNQATEKRLNFLINAAVLLAIPSILLRLVYGFYVSYEMNQRGYFNCWAYSSPSIMSNAVWVKSPGYCIDNSGQVRKEVLRWLDGFGSATPSIDEVEKHVIEMQIAWEEDQRKRFPHLYSE
ncbi:DUF1240 domain-containing protein [Corallincola platygyrae]|uniref:DUF1240 domain-containing protein n=1 Tax=Corallincola platygyrae TaxID=1193278 RepID=A0ABW4XQB1_9GAMM